MVSFHQLLQFYLQTQVYTIKSLFYGNVTAKILRLSQTFFTGFFQLAMKDMKGLEQFTNSPCYWLNNEPEPEFIFQVKNPKRDGEKQGPQVLLRSFWRHNFRDVSYIVKSEIIKVCVVKR